LLALPFKKSITGCLCCRTSVEAACARLAGAILNTALQLKLNRNVNENKRAKKPGRQAWFIMYSFSQN
jgi:hypothetical protein